MNLYLYLEILNREFLSKMLIGMESASKGANVYFGRVKPYLLRGFFAPGVILEKSNTPAPKKIKELLFYKKKNFSITSLDEESGLLNIKSNKRNNFNDYRKTRFSEKSVNLTDKIFTWGKYNFNNLKKEFKKSEKKFVLSGNPRLDFWREDFDFFYKAKKFKYSNYILFSLNIPYLVSNKEFSKKLKFLEKSEYFKRGMTKKFVIKKKLDGYNMYKKFLELIAKLSKLTKLKIIVRPHPTEPINNYKSLKKFNNVIVSKEGSLSEWIYHSRIVVHSGCNGGFESSIRGIPTIAYVPFKTTHGKEAANKYSIKANTQKKCLKFISNEINKNNRNKKNKFEQIRYYALNLLSKKPAYKIISENLLKLIRSKNLKYSNNNFFLMVRFKLRDLRSTLMNKEYGDERKFTYFDTQEVLNTFRIFQSMNPKYKNLKVIFLKKDIILIKK